MCTQRDWCSNSIDLVNGSNCRFSVPLCDLCGQTLVVVQMVLGPLLVKEGHGMGERAGLQLAQIDSTL